MDDDSFALCNDAAKPTPITDVPPEPTRQTVLFSGLDCLSGQLDLFNTDGDSHD